MSQLFWLSHMRDIWSIWVLHILPQFSGELMCFYSSLLHEGLEMKLSSFLLKFSLLFGSVLPSAPVVCTAPLAAPFRAGLTTDSAHAYLIVPLLKCCLSFCFALNVNVNLISSQGHLCSYSIHERMLKTAIKGHFLSSAKLAATLSIYTRCAWKIKTGWSLFQLREKISF